MLSKRFNKLIGVIAGFALMLPTTSFAAQSWSAVVVDQWQAGGRVNGPSSGNQSATATTSTKLGNVAGATSTVSGNQSIWVPSGNTDQRQKLMSASALEWSGGCGTGCLNISAETNGSVAQEQHASGLGILSQNASTNQQSFVGSNQSNVTANAVQNLYNDPAQRQSIWGATHAEGQSYNPFTTTGHAISAFGGQLLQTITVTAQNVFQF